MSPEEELFTSQADLLNRAVEIIGDRIRRIEELGRETDMLPKAERQKKHAILIFKSRSLRVQKKILSFLATKVTEGGEVDYYFLLPHLRTILDIYARFLHLLVNCRDEERQALTCVTSQLLFCRNFGDELYKTTLSLHTDFLKEAKFAFPEHAREFDFNFVRDRKLNFANRSILLTADNHKTYSPYTSDVFGSNKTYEIYSFFSELLHGNPYASTDEPHNERFWIVAMSVSFTAALIELVDRYTLNRVQATDFRIWLKDVDRNRKPFARLWMNKRDENHSKQREPVWSTED